MDNTRTPALLPLAAVALAALLWGVAAAVAKALFDRGVAPIELVEARAILAALGLSAIPATWRRVRGSAWPYVVLGVAIALVNVAYYLAIDLLPVAVAIVLQYTGPAFVVVWVAVVERRSPSKAVVGGLVAALLGVTLVSGALSADLGDVGLAGLGWGLMAGVMFATYTVVSDRTQAAYGALGGLRRAFTVAALVWVVFQLPRGWPSALTSSENLPLVLFVGLAGTLAPFALYIWAVARMRPERAVIAATLEPLFAALVAWVWLQESLTVTQALGGMCVLVGVTIVQLARRRADPPPTV